jgi:hypothetical protein
VYSIFDEHLNCCVASLQVALFVVGQSTAYCYPQLRCCWQRTALTHRPLLCPRVAARLALRLQACMANAKCRAIVWGIFALGAFISVLLASSGSVEASTTCPWMPTYGATAGVDFPSTCLPGGQLSTSSVGATTGAALNDPFFRLFAHVGGYFPVPNSGGTSAPCTGSIVPYNFVTYAPSTGTGTCTSYATWVTSAGNITISMSGNYSGGQFTSYSSIVFSGGPSGLFRRSRRPWQSRRRT